MVVIEFLPSDAPRSAGAFHQIPQSVFVPSYPSFSQESNDIGSFSYNPCFSPDFCFISGRGRDDFLACHHGRQGECGSAAERASSRATAAEI